MQKERAYEQIERAYEQKERAYAQIERAYAQRPLLSKPTTTRHAACCDCESDDTFASVIHTQYVWSWVTLRGPVSLKPTYIWQSERNTDVRTPAYPTYIWQSERNTDVRRLIRRLVG
jgi:hypothetical protein